MSTCTCPATTAALAPRNPPAPLAAWGGVFAMALCVFALIASEFMPVSLLTPMAADLGVSEGLAGQGIAMSGVFAVLTSLTITRLAGSLDRKTLLLWLTGAMGLSGAMVGLAPDYATYMAGRALIGVVVGGFWSLSAATAMRLVPRNQVPQALAVINGGNALATVVAAPLGSYLGTVVGWRGAFLSLVPLAAIALAWLWRSLPAMRAEPQRAAGGLFGLLRRRLVVLGMLAAALLFMGQFTLFTYLRPFLETVTRIDVATLSWMLLAMGVAGFIGTTLVGGLLKRGLYQTLALIPLLMAAIALALIALGGWAAMVLVLLIVWGLAATAAPVGWWSWLATTLPRDAEAGGGLFVAVVQFAIALGSTLGGLLFDLQGHGATFAASAALLLLASLMVLATARAERSA